jgi:hypothetical protein
MLLEKLDQLRIRRHVVGAAHQARIATQDFGHRIGIRAQDVAQLFARAVRILYDTDGVWHGRRRLGGGRGGAAEANDGHEHRDEEVAFHIPINTDGGEKG